jgi:hypothetical protein
VPPVVQINDALSNTIAVSVANGSHDCTTAAPKGSARPFLARRRAETRPKRIKSQRVRTQLLPHLRRMPMLDMQIVEVESRQNTFVGFVKSEQYRPVFV